MRKESGKFIASFYSQLHNFWKQLFAVDPQLKCYKDIELFATNRDRSKFIHFMMALCEDFESTWISLLHRMPLLSLEIVVAELILEENRRFTMKMQILNFVVATIPKTTFGSSTGRSPSWYSKNVFNKYCKFPGHCHEML